MKPVIQLRDITKTYQLGDQYIYALRGVNVTVNKGEFAAIMGPSGSGKSTMMNMIGCLDQPSSGDYLLEGLPVSEASDDGLALVRNLKIGFVFQNFHLLPRQSALENVELPMIYSNIPVKERRERAIRALQSVGLGERLYNKPSELSGGQQQRVSIARALINDPVILLADEPTGALDSRTSLEIMHIFQELNDAGKTVLIVTHEQEIAEYAKRIIRFRDGQIVSDEPVLGRRIASLEKEAVR
ncbi:ABC transporter ATP-binding protein [Ectobacillus ponti]|uniref:ABC transporter ATP-binding protein n=1 Tax=Ectobacillus ponti TaxID=2961894 RepID=A0AA42BN41_9BACI|nr:ABC transporter ATP-binding protein [Ectobacillus ponti]MCP8967555.1 ABC transporter ATP-binding protein [Ectobacillus ponti]